jgi:hypothetical protein
MVLYSLSSNENGNLNKLTHKGTERLLKAEKGLLLATEDDWATKSYVGSYVGSEIAKAVSELRGGEPSTTIYDLQNLMLGTGDGGLTGRVGALESFNTPATISNTDNTVYAVNTNYSFVNFVGSVVSKINSLIARVSALETKLNSSTTAKNLIYASPTDKAGVPVFRALATADLPTVPTTKGGTGLTATPGNSVVLGTSSAGALSYRKIVEADLDTTLKEKISGNTGSDTVTTPISNYNTTKTGIIYIKFNGTNGGSSHFVYITGAHSSSIFYDLEILMKQSVQYYSMMATAKNIGDSVPDLSYCYDQSNVIIRINGQGRNINVWTMSTTFTVSPTAPTSTACPTWTDFKKNFQRG